MPRLTPEESEKLDAVIDSATRVGMRRRLKDAVSASVVPLFVLCGVLAIGAHQLDGRMHEAARAAADAATSRERDAAAVSTSRELDNDRMILSEICSDFAADDLERNARHRLELRYHPSSLSAYYRDLNRWFDLREKHAHERQHSCASLLQKL